MGDFSRTLLILYATESLSGSLFSMRGAIGRRRPVRPPQRGERCRRVPHRRPGRPDRATGASWSAATSSPPRRPSAFALAPPTPAWLLVLFVASGLYIACEEVAEKSYAATLLPPGRRGAGMGLLAAVNGVGDMVSSALVGSLWLLSPGHGWGFAAAAALQLLGALAIASTGREKARRSRYDRGQQVTVQVPPPKTSRLPSILPIAVLFGLLVVACSGQEVLPEPARSLLARSGKPTRAAVGSASNQAPGACDRMPTDTNIADWWRLSSTGSRRQRSGWFSSPLTPRALGPDARGPLCVG